MRRVSVFSNLGEQDLGALQDAMRETPIKSGEWVFHQGDEGEAFYVVLQGTGDVLRTEEAGSEPVCLAKLQPGDVFGERSLLKSEKRYAGILATGDEGLKTMSISKEGFEKVLGPLHLLVPDKY